ncbi:hypothetical protein FIBSPDRAFT_852708 [Athelia psychrophila]|uniref:Uncharacterized protein n=1 Tax=Athelia psychrophila TaxID=1759441 RepID=A0A166RQW0_9AGAM|nr:hypothetical protein FIBSPDRAFT_852708 [Fibularhizoctonia sp. CBS 109695]
MYSKGIAQALCTTPFIVSLGLARAPSADISTGCMGACYTRVHEGLLVITSCSVSPTRLAHKGSIERFMSHILDTDKLRNGSLGHNPSKKAAASAIPWITIGDACSSTAFWNHRGPLPLPHSLRTATCRQPWRPNPVADSPRLRLPQRELRACLFPLLRHPADQMAQSSAPRPTPTACASAPPQPHRRTGHSGRPREACGIGSGCSGFRQWRSRISSDDKGAGRWAGRGISVVSAEVGVEELFKRFLRIKCKATCTTANGAIADAWARAPQASCLMRRRYLDGDGSISRPRSGAMTRET